MHLIFPTLDFLADCVGNSFMQKDTRKNNLYFGAKSIFRYLQEYTGAIAYGLNKVDQHQLEKAKDLLCLTQSRDGRIFVGGNGGSAAISDHLACDFGKGTMTEKKGCLKTSSLVGGISLLTAIGNDLGYEKTLSFQLELARAEAKDLLILISSSGNSKNILLACEYALKKGMDVIGFTGFSGGELKDMCTCSLHIPVQNYGVVEDCHQALMHVLAQFHYVRADE
jgi:D-sedoheptulose 7-phosphate isomerase